MAETVDVLDICWKNICDLRQRSCSALWNTSVVLTEECIEQNERLFEKSLKKLFCILEVYTLF